MQKLHYFKKFILIGLVLLASVMLFSFTTDFFKVSKSLEVFAALFRDVNTYYVDEVKPGDLMKKGIDGMLNSLDPYTDYIPESDIEDYRFMTTGQYGGIGSTVRKNGDFVYIAEPYEGFPAFKADLRAGDKIVEIDGKSIKGKNTDEVSKLLKGQPGTEVVLTIERPKEKEPITKKLKREEIKINAVPYYGLMENNYGYVNLNQFTESASREVKAAIEEMNKDGQLKGLVFDLRGNPGGLLNEAINICNFFVDKGQDVVFTKGKVKEWEKNYKALNNPLAKDLPVVLLVNSGSASASEIVSGTMQDLDRGVIVGQKTYGKGLVQSTRQLTYNSKLKVTTAKYYIPSGRCIQAIDYANRNEDGSVGKIPDSLAKAFKTKNGRVVYDGGGIAPDIKLKSKSYSKIAISLINKNLIFDFATEYRLAHPTISAAKEFRISDNDYKEFIAFLENKEYDYTTKTENLLKDLKEVTEQERYYQDAQKEYEALAEKLKHDKLADLENNKQEIKELIEAEICSRYYFQKGRIINNLSKDEEVKRALKILATPGLYISILKGDYKETENESK